MVKYLSLTVIITAILFSGCGQTPMEAGDSAFDDQNYAEALKYYLEAFKEEPNNPTLKEKIALCYFKEGEKIYLRTRVIKALEARIRSGVLNLPEYPSENLKKTVSEMHLLLGLAYTAAKADNPYQEKKYFNNAIQNLEIAIKYDSTNTQAQEAFARLKDENFTEIYEKGVAAYNKGKSDDLQYIAADYYLSNALKLDPDHEKAAKYLSLARKRSLNLLDPGMDVPIAITDRMQNPEYTAFLIVAYNQMPENLYVSANSFVLVKKGGGEFYGKTSNMFTTPLEGTTLSNGEEVSGVVAFPTTGDISLARVELRKDGEVLGYKNLP